MDVDEYTFTWYLDITATDDIDVGDAGMANVTFSGSGALGNTANGDLGVNIIDGLPSGTYYVQADDQTNSVGC